MSTHRHAWIGSAVALLTAIATSSVIAQKASNEKPHSLPDGTGQLSGALDLAARGDMFRAANPGVSIGTWQGHSSVYGKSFANGGTAKDSVELFRKEMLPMFGVAPEELVSGMRHLPAGDNTLQLMPDGQGGYKFTAVYYTQFRDGVEVFGTGMVGLVRNEPGYPLVL